MKLDMMTAPQSTTEDMDFRNEISDVMHVDSRVSEAKSESDDGLEIIEPNDVRIVPKVDGDLDLMSEFDDYVANEKQGALLGKSRALSFGFELGDLVWGKVKSHPWWPGHIFNEALASSSVCRTRREGYVLVAFFGDSSYGWFDPAELIPFGSNHSEKSQQITSRTFVKAVEEAMDETSRRCGLGLTCKCRNPYNFRPTNVEGYFAVDVPDYEPNGVYSANQIRKARDRFKPYETLSFIKQLALAPQQSEQKSIDFIEKMATVFAYRKAVFEEYDETYAQAFGTPSARPAQNHAHLKDQASKKRFRAPLSGPLVIAETLGGGKSAKKPMKVKDHSKKDKYLFKRRDEPVEIKQGQPSSSFSSTLMEGSSAVEAGEYVLQKRAPVAIVHEKSEQLGSVSGVIAGSPVNVSSDLALQGDKKPSLDMLESKEKMRSDVLGVIDSSSTPLQQEDNGMIDLKHEQSAESSAYQQSNSNLPSKVEGGEQVQDGRSGGQSKPVGSKRPAGTSTDGKVKKLKVLKWKSADLSSENSDTIEKKKKRKKKETTSETNLDRPRKRMALGKGETPAGDFEGKSGQISLAPTEDSQKNGLGSTNSLFSSTMSLQPDLELPLILGDLRALALDPFHGAERDSPTIVRQFFLRFRSLVYQKSLVPSESDPVEVRAPRDSQPGKPVLKPGIPKKTGRKSMISERQEEIAAKRLKKLGQIKSLAAEKKSTQKTVEASRTEVKDQVASTPSKPIRHDSTKKTAVPPTRVVQQPTMLVMKFPPNTSLPSGAELKAKFGRFGSLDQSAIRVFWKTFTCRVVFRHKADAEAAYKYAMGNKSLFGNVRVRYMVREAGAEPDKGREDVSVETIQFNDPATNNRALAARLIQPAVQLKSCLKKPTSDDGGVAATTGGGNNNNGGRGTTRVKFFLGGEESSNRGETLMIGNRNNFDDKNVSFADGGQPSSVAMDYNSKNFQTVVPSNISSNVFPLAPPQFANTNSLPLAPQFTKTPLNNTFHNEAPLPPPPPPPPRPINSHMNLNPSISTSTPSSSSVDISQKMLSLLTRCNEVVNNVTGMLGYVPYHPL